MYIIKDNSKSFITLQGGREVSDFIEFIKKKATNPPVLPVEEKKSKKKKKKSDKEEL